MSRRYWKRFLFFTLSLPLSLSLLHADDFFKVKDQLIQESKWKLGFLYLTPMMLLQNIGYTSSIYTYEEEEYPDWTGDVGVGLRASSIIANRLILQVEDLPHYSFYLKTEELRSWSNQLGVKLDSYAGPVNLKLGFKRDDLTQRPRLEFSRPYHYSNSEWSGGVDIGKRNSLFVTAYFSLDEFNYDDDPYWGDYSLANRLNRKENAYGLRLNKPVFTSTLVFADYRRIDYRFEQSAERNAKAQQVSLGVQFPEVGALQGDFQIGISRLEPDNPLFKKAQRANGRGNVRLKLADRFRFNVYYDLDTLFSYGATDSFYDNSSLGGGVEVYLTRFLKAGGSYQDSRLKYYSFVDLKLQRTDRTRQQQYFLAVPFIGRTSIGFSYNIYRLTSDVLKLDYTRSFWGGFLSYEF